MLSVIVQSPFIQTSGQSPSSSANARLGTLRRAPPDFLKIREQLADARRQLDAEIAKAVANARAEYESAFTQEQTLNAALAQQQTAVSALDRKGVDYTLLQREAESNREIYNMLLQRERELRVIANSRSNNVRVIDTAEVPTAPYAPNHRQDWIFGLFFGGVLAVAAAFGLDYLDDTVKTPEDVTRRLNLRLLGLVPSVRGDRHPLLSGPVPHDFGEAFRALRTSLIALVGGEDAGARRDQRPAAEGKTTAVNMAMALAVSGSRVLLIDADMRRPSVNRAMRLPNDRGLSQLLAGQARMRERRADARSEPARHHRRPHSGQPVRAALLRPHAGAGQRARERPFDWIVIDTPPVLAVTDAAIVAPLVSAVTLVIGAEMTRWRLAEHAVETIRGPAAPGDRRSTRWTSRATGSTTRATTATTTRATTPRLRRPGDRAARAAPAARGRRLCAAGRRPPPALALLLAVRGRALACPRRAWALARTRRSFERGCWPAGAVALQMVPLPPLVPQALSPQALATRRGIRLVPPEGWPLRSTLAATALSLATLALAALTYLAARSVLDHEGGIRRVCRLLAWFGAAAAIVAVAQRGAAPGLVMGLVPPEAPGARPFGPFVNRNHFAGWLVLVMPVVAGYLTAHLRHHLADARTWHEWRRHVGRSVALPLVVSLVMMVGVLLLTLSRSAVLGAGAGAVAWWLMSRRRMGAGGGAGLLAGGVLGLVLLSAALLVDPTPGRRDSRARPVWRDGRQPARHLARNAAGDRRLLGHRHRVRHAARPCSPTSSPASGVPHLGAWAHFNQAHNHYLHCSPRAGCSSSCRPWWRWPGSPPRPGGRWRVTGRRSPDSDGRRRRAGGHGRAERLGGAAGDAGQRRDGGAGDRHPAARAGRPSRVAAARGAAGGPRCGRGRYGSAAVRRHPVASARAVVRPRGSTPARRRRDASRRPAGRLRGARRSEPSCSRVPARPGP